MAKWFTVMSASLQEGVLNGFAISFPRSFPYGGMAMQFMLSVFIIDNLAVIHQCLDACNEILGVLSWPGHNIFKFSEVHMGVECHVSFPAGFGQGRQKLSPWLLSVPLCCQ